MQRSYGTLLGVPEQRVLSSQDGQRILLAGRELLLLDTPGHARHHHCVWDARSGGWFTGDTFGLSYREFDAPDGRPWLLPTSTPVQFEPEALKASVARLLNVQPRAMFLTHFGRIGRDAEELRALAQRLLALVDAMVAAALAAQGQPDRHATLKAALLQLYQNSARQHGSTLSPAQMAALLAMDVELNAQGLGIWLDRQDK
jgi:glyoxylase-like metal-dependent hydrolase (beta-lactamase superfamily II)